MRLRFQKGDLLAIVIVLLLAAAVFFLFLPKADTPGVRANIYQNGELVQSLPLSQDGEFTVSGAYTNIITVRDGQIAITDSTCPGGDCVRCGWLDTPGRTIVCLPNGLEIRIYGAVSGVDFAVG